MCIYIIYIYIYIFPVLGNLQTHNNNYYVYIVITSCMFPPSSLPSKFVERVGHALEYVHAVVFVFECMNAHIKELQKKKQHEYI